MSRKRLVIWEDDGGPDDEPQFTTTTGKIITNGDLREWQREAEAGYSIFTCPVCDTATVNQKYVHEGYCETCASRTQPTEGD